MSAGLLLPVGVVQPFDLRLHRDDVHAIACLDGHPVYEALEAMLRRRDGAPLIARVILTRHDQSQVDHVNDDELFAIARSSGRETCLRAISVREERAAAGPRLRVDLDSHAGERLSLDAVASSEPDARFGGLTDPGRHSAATSFTVMWRGRSALAGPETRVAIGGADLGVRRGYYSEGHTMGVLRASRRELELLEAPARLEPGERWLYATREGRIAYRVVEGGHTVRIERRDRQVELVRGRPEGGRLRMTEVRVGGVLRLGFEAQGEFSVGIESAGRAVHGACDSRELAGETSIRLAPREPAWARGREIEVRCARTRARLTLATRISPRAGERRAT